MKVAILRHNGLFYGGTEKFLQIMAAETNNEVDYYTTDLMASPDREQYLLDAGVNIIKFKMGSTKFPWKYFRNAWYDLWRKFKSNYDVIQITNFGWQELPYNGFHEDDPLCEFTVFPPYTRFPGVKHHILNSEWLRQKWVSTGGSLENSTAIPVPCKITAANDLRNELGIHDDTIVFGFHQRASDEIFSPVQLEAYKRIETPDTHMVVLNGSQLYWEQAKQLKIHNISFIDYQDEVSQFLNTLDIYTHGRKDGETYGMVLAEAMLHGKPCISHYTPYYNAMSSVIQDGGVVVNNVDEYATMLQLWIDDPSLRQCIGKRAHRVAHDNYTYDTVIPRINEVWRKVANG